jgi:site-specific DNA recombinase
VTAAPQLRPLRVAVYTRKSVTDGLEQEFNSLDAQRQAVECYVQSQAGLGWRAIEKRYDDGGFSGATTDRPAFQALLRDIEAGQVDIVAVYKIDRLSRSLRDFAKLIDVFERFGVTFVSVTQQFSTANSIGKLTLNILMSFAEFEREVIGERIRDKVRATRRRGAWTGGRPILGYDVVAKQLVVNADEAAQVRELFELYLRLGNLREVLAEIRRRGWTNKSFTGKRGQAVAGHAFTKSTLHRLLTNSLYTGQIRAGTDLVPGAHEALIETDLWAAVQQQLADNGTAGGARARNKTNALLRELVYCGRCGSGMVHTFTTRGPRRHRYYVCAKLHGEGAEACPGARLAAGTFEQFVLDQVRTLGTDESVIAGTADAANRLAAERHDQLAAEARRTERRLRSPLSEGDRTQLQERLVAIRAELGSLASGIDDRTLRTALGSFQPVWEHLFPAEQERILRLLIQRITFHPDDGDVDIELRPCGIQSLAAEATTTS